MTSRENCSCFLVRRTTSAVAWQPQDEESPKPEAAVSISGLLLRDANLVTPHLPAAAGAASNAQHSITSSPASARQTASADDVSVKRKREKRRKSQNATSITSTSTSAVRKEHKSPLHAALASRRSVLSQPNSARDADTCRTRNDDVIRRKRIMSAPLEGATPSRDVASNLLDDADLQQAMQMSRISLQGKWF